MIPPLNLFSRSTGTPVFRRIFLPALISQRVQACRRCRLSRCHTHRATVGFGRHRHLSQSSITLGEFQTSYSTAWGGGLVVPQQEVRGCSSLLEEQSDPPLASMAAAVGNGQEQEGVSEEEQYLVTRQLSPRGREVLFRPASKAHAVEEGTAASTPKGGVGQQAVPNGPPPTIWQQAGAALFYALASLVVIFVNKVRRWDSINTMLSPVRANNNTTVVVAYVCIDYSSSLKAEARV